MTEWPGGEPASVDLKVSDPEMKAVLRGAAYIPMGPVAGRRFLSSPACPGARACDWVVGRSGASWSPARRTFGRDSGRSKWSRRSRGRERNRVPSDTRADC